MCNILPQAFFKLFGGKNILKGFEKMIDEKRFSKTQVKEMSQNIILENRKKLTVSGVNDVESFDEDSIVLLTEDGSLQIKGSEMHINKLSVETGEVIIEGAVGAMIYTDEDGHTKGGLISKLFR